MNQPTVPLVASVLQDAIDAVNREEIVFDSFDTLLVRDVHPDRSDQLVTRPLTE